MKNPEYITQAERRVALSLAGLAIGIYGLTQSILQIPIGCLSNRIGRKPVIQGGLWMSAIGSVAAAMPHPLQHRESCI